MQLWKELFRSAKQTSYRSNNKMLILCKKGRIIDGYLVIRKVGKINNETHLSWECKCLKCGRKIIISSLNLANKDINKIPKCKCHSKKPIAKKKKTNNLVGQLF